MVMVMRKNGRNLEFENNQSLKKEIISVSKKEKEKE